MVKNLVLRVAAVAVAMAIGQAYAADTKPIDVPAGELTLALETLAKQSGVEFVYEVQQLKGLQTKGVHGQLTPENAVTKLLEGTKLVVTMHQSGAVLIAAPQASSKTARPEDLAEAQPMRLAQTENTQSADNQETKNSPPELSSNDSATSLQEVLVTAQKREERLIDVPMSMDVVGADTIVQRGLVNSEDYLREIPGVVQENQGYLGSQDITIRGINSGGGNFGSGTTFASYFGEVPTSSSSAITGTSAIDIKLVDVARVEVLRGPQGVSFGDASLGGAIRVIPNAPKIGAFEGLASGEFSQSGGSGGDNARAHGAINIPLGDSFALRAVAYRFDDTGYYRNRAGSNASFQSGPVTQLGAQASAVDRDHVGDTRTIGGRAALLFEASEDLNFTLNVLRQETEIDGVPIENNGPFTQTLFQIDPAQSRRGQVDGFADNFLTLYNPVVTYDTGWGSLLATYSHMDSGSNSAQPYNIFGLNWPLSQGQDGEHTEDVLELRFASELTGPINFVVGAFAEKVVDEADFTFYWYGTAPFFFTPGHVGLAELDRELRQNALYAQAFWEIVPTLKLGVGARYYDYKREFSDVRSGAFLGSVDFHGTLKANGVTPRIDLSYSANSDIMVYGSYSEGFRLGTPSSVLPASVCDVDGNGLIDGTNVALADTALVGADDINNYELGLKSNLPDHAGSISLAAYRMVWSGIPTVGLAPCGLTYQMNAGTAKSNGIEISTELHLARSLNLTAGVSYNNARFDEAVPALGIPEGARVGGTDVNGNIGIEYQFALAGRPTFARIDTLYVGYRGDPALGDPLKPYTKVDFTAGFAFNNNIEISLFARNLFDSDALVSRMPEANGVDTGWRLIPRTFGVRLNYRLDH